MIWRVQHVENELTPKKLKMLVGLSILDDFLAFFIPRWTKFS